MKADKQFYDDILIMSNLTAAQQHILAQAPENDWFPVSWEGFKGVYRSLMSLELTHAREPGMQVLSEDGRRLRVMAREWNML